MLLIVGNRHSSLPSEEAYSHCNPIGSICATLLSMRDEIGLREVRQNASQLVRRAQAGERLTITVSGRPAASLGPVEVASWASWASVADVFTGPGDPEWQADRDRLDGSLRDPWDQ
jgi:prevent-host-death family protein